jgi:hypothetical protein
MSTPSEVTDIWMFKIPSPQKIFNDSPLTTLQNKVYIPSPGVFLLMSVLVIPQFYTGFTDGDV